MTAYEIIEKLETIAPNKMAAKWDNPGLLVGKNREVKKVIFAVDASDYIIDEAVKQGVDMIITHHPLIFTGLKKVSENDFIGRRVLEMASNGIVLYAMHTNFDICQLTDAAGSKLGINKQGIIEVVDKVKSVDSDEIVDIGYGVYGNLDADALEEASNIGTTSNENALTVMTVAELVKSRFNLNSVRVFGNLRKQVNVVGVFPGSGKSSIDDAIANKIDVLVTGDIDHHSGIDAVARGLCVIDAGHYGIEKVFVECMLDYFAKEMPSIETIGISDDFPFVTV